MIGNLITKAMFSSNVVASTIGRVVYKNADKILLGAGVGLVVAGTVSACKTSVKVKEIKHYLDGELSDAADIEDKKERGKAKVSAYKNFALSLIEEYGPCVLLTGLGISCILGSHYILSRRYAALEIAYVTLDKSFKEYRERVGKKIGDKAEYDIYTNAEEIEKIDIDENGKNVTKKVKVRHGSNSPYEFIFDEANPNWTKDPNANWTFLEQQQWYANDRLNRKGIITLAEVLYDLSFFDDMRDIPSYAFDMIWEKQSEKGDGYIDFGHRFSEDFKNGTERSVILNFNCDGLLRKVRGENEAILKTQKAA